jgi:hypothetical protein
MNRFDGLKAIVQYRRAKCADDPWINMAAFDMLFIADEYAEKLQRKNDNWEYRVISIGGNAE